MWMVIITASAGVSLGIIGSFLVISYAPQLALIDKPKQRSSHSFPVPRGGGIGIFTAFILVGFFIRYDISFIVLACIAGLLGLMEDRFALSAKLRLLIQLIIAGSVVLTFRGVPGSITEIVFFAASIFFITGTANFYNFMDGINGIAGLTAVVSFGLLAFFCFFIINNTEIGLISISLLSASMGFLPFNFPKAKVFMGDVGSIFLGFVFASFVVKLSTDINMFLCLIMFLCTFYADAIVTIIFRCKQAENLMKAHRSHLYQYVSNELAVPHWKVSIVYAAIQFVIGFLALLVFKKGLYWQLAVFTGFGSMFFIAYKVIKNIKPMLPMAQILQKDIGGNSK